MLTRTVEMLSGPNGDVQVGPFDAQVVSDELQLAPEDLLKPKERRLARRYPIELPAELYADNEHVTGTTANISANGVLIMCSNPDLAAGTRVKVQIARWPVRRHRNKMLTLIIEGHITRGSVGSVAVRLLRYHFAEL
jgi:hypothetical protein